MAVVDAERRVEKGNRASARRAAAFGGEGPHVASARCVPSQAAARTARPHRNRQPAAAPWQVRASSVAAWFDVEDVGGPQPPACGGPRFWQTCERSAGCGPNKRIALSRVFGLRRAARESFTPKPLFSIVRFDCFIMRLLSMCCEKSRGGGDFFVVKMRFLT